VRRLVIEVIALALFCFFALAPGPAYAGGLEYAGAGAEALGRGGAAAARASSPMVLADNPAGLAELRGGQLLLDMNLALMNACVDPIGYYGWGIYGGGRPIRLPDASTGEETILSLGQPGPDGQFGAAEQAFYVDPLDTVCMDQHVVPVPQIALTWRITEDLGVGLGLIFPAVTPQGSWGDENGIIHTDDGLRPAATRYMLLNANSTGMFPTLGVGYRLARWLRVGAAFDWGLIASNVSLMAATSGGTAPNGDIITELQAWDLFVPGFTASIHVVPIDSIDIVAAFRYQDAFHAENGTVDLTTGVFNPDGVRHTTPIELVEVHQDLPWKLRLGIRYADRLAPRPTGAGGGPVVPDRTVHDPLQDEKWDIEIDAEYQLNSRNQEQWVVYEEEQLLYFEGTSGDLTATQYPAPSQPPTIIQKRWQDQISLRAGGTYNLFPGIFGISAGAHYENRGVDPDFMQIDYWPVSRVGLHTGIIVRINGFADLLLSYAHIFQETIVVAAPPQEDAGDIYDAFVEAPTEGVTTVDKTVGARASITDVLEPLPEQNPPSDPDGTARLNETVTRFSSNQPPWIVNSGAYRSSINVLALGVRVHF
jgi:long-subunit fatty acid transport protein